jgi:hypothetical protein
VEDVVDAADRLFGDRHVGEIAVEELDTGDVREIRTFAADQIVDNTDRVAPIDERFGKANTRVRPYIQFVNPL